MIDLVCPKGNESEFVKMASRLGYSELCFVYNINEEVKAVQDKKIKVSYGVACKPSEAGKAKERFNLVSCEAGEDNRTLFDKTKPDIVFNLENSPKADFIYNRNSGLDQVSCKAANKNKMAVAFNISNLINSSNRAQLLGRTMQNISFCKKYKVNMVIASFAKEPSEMRAPNDLVGMFTVLGMSPNEAKKALNTADEIIRNNTNKKSKDYIQEGVRFISQNAD